MGRKGGSDLNNQKDMQAGGTYSVGEGGGEENLWKKIFEESLYLYRYHML